MHPVRCFTGDEVGLVKEIRIIAGKPPQDNLKENNTPDQTKLALKDDRDVCVKIFGSQGTPAVDRQKQIDVLTMHVASQQLPTMQKMEKLVTGCKDGVIRVYQTAISSQAPLEEIPCFVPQAGVNKRKQTEHFIGVHAIQDTLIWGTDTGKVSYSSFQETEPTLPRVVGTLKQDNLCRLRVHQKQPHVFITGGIERDLVVWDAHHTHQDKDTTVFDPVWKAKNVAHDELDLRQPIWITDCQFMEPHGDASKIIVGTGYHQLRLYDVRDGNAHRKNKREWNRPVWDISVGENPIKSLAVDPDACHVVFSDTMGALSVFDVRNQKVVGAYKGSTGAITDIYMFQHQPYVAAVGIDRFLRIWERDGRRRLLHKVYLKQRMTSVLFDEHMMNEWISQEKRKQEDEEDVWQTMRVVR